MAKVYGIEASPVASAELREGRVPVTKRPRVVPHHAQRAGQLDAVVQLEGRQPHGGGEGPGGCSGVPQLDTKEAEAAGVGSVGRLELRRADGVRERRERRRAPPKPPPEGPVL
jgi:hypothetical protein